jgi:hypothetical protein
MGTDGLYYKVREKEKKFEYLETFLAKSDWG